MNPELIGASQLRQWATNRSRDAQEHFPQLMRRLLVETAGITSISIRAGDGIALEGYDGLADSAGTSFLPAGQLVFEFGVGDSPESKATSDYLKRASKGSSSEIFVFATPRRWPRGSKWAQERKLEGKFADVRVLDADDLEAWLLTAPGAHYWISEHLGLRPRDAVSLDRWWQRFTASTQPQLPSDLFLSGRRAQAAQLVERLSNVPTLTVVQSEWADDCLAFLYAALSISEDVDDFGTVVVVSSAEAWDSILEKPGQAVLIPVFEAADVASAISKGHHVVTVIDRAAKSWRAVDFSLARLDPGEAAEALRGVGIEFGEAHRLAALGRRSMPALRRRLSLNPRVKRPEWADPPDARILAGLLVAGAWTSDPDDILMLEAITKQPWEVIEPLVSRLCESTDPLIRKVRSSWSFVSPEEAFLFLADSMTAELLQRSVEVITQVVSETDPTLDLAPGERVTAGIRGVRRRFSGTLRSGLAQGLALLGAMGSQVVLEDGSSPADVAARTVHYLLETANADQTGRLWRELAGVLPLLAEAAPGPFIEALNDDLRGTNPVVLNLFEDEDGTTLSMGPSSAHPYLLWALETVCWSADFLVDGVRVLTRLAAVDPGGKSANRPLASLTSILCGWARHTSATTDERLQALDVAYSVADEIGWKLNFALWPNNGGLIVPPVEPRFRYWRPTETAMPMAEWIAFAHALVTRAIHHAGADADRLGQLAEGMPAVSPEDRKRIMAVLTDWAEDGTRDPESRLLLWERLRALTTHHQQYASADWALPPDFRERLNELTLAVEPRSGPQRFSYLFDWHPDLPDVDQTDFESYSARLSSLRRDALLSVLDSAGIDSLVSLVRRAPEPSQVGWALAEIDDVDLPELIPWISSDDAKLVSAASTWVSRRIHIRGSEWFRRALLVPDLRGATRDFVVCHAPPTREIWEALRDSPVSGDEQTYWENATFEVVPLPDVDEALDQLLRHGRAWVAVGVAALAVQQAADNGAEDGTGSYAATTTETIMRVLDGALREPPQRSQLSSMTAFYVGQLLDYLSEQGDLENAVARYEFAYFRLLEHQREPTALNRVLATQPEIFVDLVKRAYRGRSEQRRELSENEQGQATQAWWILHQWKGFPGRCEDGGIDREVMTSWVSAVRLALSEVDRSDIGDEMIGQSFARSPVGSDGVWPCEPLRDLLEAIGSRELENGVVLGRMNARGVTSRGVYEGGTQERELAKQYRDGIPSTRAKWPRTARVLRDLADAYERDARWHDTHAELDADRG